MADALGHAIQTHSHYRQGTLTVALGTTDRQKADEQSYRSNVACQAILEEAEGERRGDPKPVYPAPPDGTLFSSQLHRSRQTNAVWPSLRAARDQHELSAQRTGTYRRFPVDHRNLAPQTVAASLVGPAISVSDEAIEEMAGPVRRGARHPTQMREYKGPSTSLWTVRNQVIIFRQMFEFALGKP